MEMEIDIETEVMRKYPVIEEEQRCRTHRDFRNMLRHEYRLKLMKQQREQAEANNIQSAQLPANETLGGNVQ